jgi:hypothetical protein
MSAVDMIDAALGIVMSIFVIIASLGECTSGKHRLAALMAAICLVRNGIQLIRLLMAIRK